MSKGLAVARRHFPDAWLLAFMNTASERGETAPCMLIKARVRGETLDGYFRERTNKGRGSINTELNVERLSPRVFRITFGDHGPGFGSGGVYRVTFTGRGVVQRLVPEGFWIH